MDSAPVRRRGDTDAAIADLRAVFGDRPSLAAAVRAQHDKDMTHLAGMPPDAVAFVRDTAEGLTAPILGHVGGGNFHVLVLVDPADADELRRVTAVNGRMLDRALAIGGTATGEHGLGIGKKPCLRKEHGVGVDPMAAIKAAIDPGNIMNPGKIFDLPAG